MSLGNITDALQGPATLQKAGTSGASQASSTETAKAETATQKTDSFEKNSEAKSVTYEKPKKLSATQLKGLQEQQIASFKQMLSSMLTEQGKKKLEADGLTKDLFKGLTVSDADAAQAQAAISEDGAWGVNAVATNIMDMAVALSGGDTSKISILRDAVEKGFEAAGVAWGGAMPSITGDTHKEISDRFDYWEEHGSLDGYKMD